MDNVPATAARRTISVRPIARSSRVRRGNSLILGTLCMGVLAGFGSFAVDLGRVQLAKAELRRAADAAARAGAAGLEVTVAQARFDARDWAKRNAVDGRAIADAGIVVTVGNWNESSRKFNDQAEGVESVNAVRVVLTRPATGPESIPLFWGAILGIKGVTVSAESVARFVPGENVSHRVDGVANPFLAGMPAGSAASLYNPHNSPDQAGDAAANDAKKRKQSPPVVPFVVEAGQAISFDDVAGTVKHDPNLNEDAPDGEIGNTGGNSNGSENGIADTSAPINALVGVFLDDDRPDRTAAPATDRSFASESGREFGQLRPQLKQVFFIGDGTTQSGQKQRFVVPPGATRLYLATWDFYEWNNNSGYRIVKVKRPGRVITVK